MIKKDIKIRKSIIIKTSIILILCILLAIILPLFIYIDFSKSKFTYDDDFRYALSVSPFSKTALDKGYTYESSGNNISNIEELEQAYIEMGATEMFTRIGTKRHVTDEDITYGKADSNANVHTFDQGIELCELAAKLDIPINPEIMCAYTYMDMAEAQAPDFSEYPEFNTLMAGKDWSELSLEEINKVLEAYGYFVSSAILDTGCTVNCWNIGNEANFGFAGVSLGLKTAVNPKLENVSGFKRYMLPLFGTHWMKENIWKYNAQMMASLQDGILRAYKEKNISSSGVHFCTHVATVVSTPHNLTTYFNTLKEYGYNIDTAGISFYPSASAAAPNRMIMFKRTVNAINKKCNLPVFIAEFSYPSGEMTGDFSGWNKKCNQYEISESGQAAIYKDVIEWGKNHGVCGIRYWAIDYEGWSSMSGFNFDGKHGTPKLILQQYKE